MRYFLIVYDTGHERLVESHDFAVEDRAAALKLRRDLQRRFLTDPEFEVVLLGAERFEDLERTHGRYFKTTREIMQTAHT